jgi:hypothetical protein
MNTNHLMLKELKEKYHPVSMGVVSTEEAALIKETLCLEKMDVLALRNLRDFTTASMSHSNKMEDWDKMSAIVYVIDRQIVEMGGEV